jgi:hypothetical protein
MEYKVEGMKHKLIAASACRQCLFFINSPTYSEHGQYNYLCCIYEQPLRSGMGKPAYCEFKGIVGVFENRVPVTEEVQDKPVSKSPKAKKKKGVKK